MKVFDHFNSVGDPCVLCGSRDDKKIGLVRWDGTELGGIEQAIQVHIDCIELRYIKERGLLYQKITP
jgi:hypothetical protein